MASPTQGRSTTSPLPSGPIPVVETCPSSTSNLASLVNAFPSNHDHVNPRGFDPSCDPSYTTFSNFSPSTKRRRAASGSSSSQPSQYIENKRHKFMHDTMTLAFARIATNSWTLGGGAAGGGAVGSVDQPVLQPARTGSILHHRPPPGQDEGMDYEVRSSKE